MKRLLNESFLYEGNSYFIKNINETIGFSLCYSCPLAARFIGCIPTEIINCHGRCEIMKK